MRGVCFSVFLVCFCFVFNHRRIDKVTNTINSLLSRLQLDWFTV